MFASIRKLVVGAVGLAAVILESQFNFGALVGLESVVVELVLGILTAIGIYQAPNDSA